MRIGLPRLASHAGCAASRRRIFLFLRQRQLGHAEFFFVMQIKHVKTKLAMAIESLEDRRLMSTYTVTTTADSGAGSLRQAITDANNHLGADEIHFAIGSGAKTITPSKGLPG